MNKFIFMGIILFQIHHIDVFSQISKAQEEMNQYKVMYDSIVNYMNKSKSPYYSYKPGNVRIAVSKKVYSDKEYYNYELAKIGVANNPDMIIIFVRNSNFNVTAFVVSSEDDLIYENEHILTKGPHTQLHFSLWKGYIRIENVVNFVGW